MDLATSTPAQIDEKLADINERLHRANLQHQHQLDRLHRMTGDAQHGGRWSATTAQTVTAAWTIVNENRDHLRGYSDGAVRKTLTALYATEDEITDLAAEAAPLESEYDRRPWSRFFLAKSHDGHVHSSQECSTCHNGNERTAFWWQPEMSGKTEAEAVAEYGMTMCTVCFPTAPADPAFKLEPRARREARQAKDAAKAERETAKAAKAITNPDGTPLKLTGRFGETIQTLVTARNTLAAKLFDAGFYPQLPGYEGHDTTDELADAQILIAAIAHKTGRTEDDVRAEAKAKADKKIAKELK
jgi:hypothetical protein